MTLALKTMRIINMFKLNFKKLLIPLIIEDKIFFT